MARVRGGGREGGINRSGQDRQGMKSATLGNRGGNPGGRVGRASPRRSILVCAPGWPVVSPGRSGVTGKSIGPCVEEGSARGRGVFKAGGERVSRPARRGPYYAATGIDLWPLLPMTRMQGPALLWRRSKRERREGATLAGHATTRHQERRPLWLVSGSRRKGDF